MGCVYPAVCQNYKLSFKVNLLEQACSPLSFRLVLSASQPPFQPAPRECRASRQDDQRPPLDWTKRRVPHHVRPRQQHRAQLVDILAFPPPAALLSSLLAPLPHLPFKLLGLLWACPCLPPQQASQPQTPAGAKRGREVKRQGSLRGAPQGAVQTVAN